jgi:phosphoglycerate kinase
MSLKLKLLPEEKNISGLKILVRIDANFDASLSDSLRISRVKNDILNLIDRGARVILCTHRGKPKGREETLSTEHLVSSIENTLGQKVIFADTLSPLKIKNLLSKNPEAVLLLENTRFEKGELSNSWFYARKLSRIADIFVNTAFSVCHRKHASVHRITSFLPSYASKAIQAEVDILSKPISEPFVLIVGGIKISSKISLIKQLAPKAEFVILGSGYANLWRSLRTGVLNKELGLTGSEVKSFKKLLKLFGEKIVLPNDIRVYNRPDDDEIVIRSLSQLQPDDTIIDIGPDSELAIADYVSNAKSVIWNGPLGIVENEEGRGGTLSLIDVLINERLVKTILGGGDTIKLLTEEEVDQLYYVSTGGGAMLAFLAGEKMPGLNVLK